MIPKSNDLGIIGFEKNLKRLFYMIKTMKSDFKCSFFLTGGASSCSPVLQVLSSIDSVALVISSMSLGIDFGTVV